MPTSRSQRKILWFTLTTSLVLFIIVAVASISIQRAEQQAELAESKALAVSQAYNSLEITTRELRHQLALFGATGQDTHMAHAGNSHKLSANNLLLVKQWEVTEDERAIVTRLQQCSGMIEAGMQGMNGEQQQANRRSAATRMVNDVLDSEMLTTIQLQSQKKQTALQAARVNHHESSAQAAWLLWLLGGLGIVAGVLAGYSLARSLEREMVELQLPIQSASGALRSVIGPLQVSAHQSDDLESSAQLLAKQVTAVVDRLQVAEREIVRKDQLAALGQLAAGLAHELRNPLTAIKTLIDTAKSQPSSGSLDGQDLDVMDEEVTRLNKTLQHFLDYARPPTAVKVKMDLSEAVRKVTQLLSSRAQHLIIEVGLQLPQDPVSITADPEQVHQVLLNLFLNAFDAIGMHGKVSLMETSDATTKTATLQICDTGPGIPDSMRDRLFEPFASSKASGTGLGLAICKRIVEEHGGTIQAANNPKGGACFTVTFPW